MGMLGTQWVPDGCGGVWVGRPVSGPTQSLACLLPGIVGVLVNGYDGDPTIQNLRQPTVSQTQLLFSPYHALLLEPCQLVGNGCVS